MIASLSSLATKPHALIPWGAPVVVGGRGPAGSGNPRFRPPKDLYCDKAKSFRNRLRLSLEENKKVLECVSEYQQVFGNIERSHEILNEISRNQNPINYLAL